MYTYGYGSVEDSTVMATGVTALRNTAGTILLPCLAEVNGSVSTGARKKRCEERTQLLRVPAPLFTLFPKTSDNSGGGLLQGIGAGSVGAAAGGVHRSFLLAANITAVNNSGEAISYRGIDCFACLLADTA